MKNLFLSILVFVTYSASAQIELNQTTMKNPQADYIYQDLYNEFEISGAKDCAACVVEVKGAQKIPVRGSQTNFVVVADSTADKVVIDYKRDGSVIFSKMYDVKPVSKYILVVSRRMKEGSEIPYYVCFLKPTTEMDYISYDIVLKSLDFRLNSSDDKRSKNIHLEGEDVLKKLEKELAGTVMGESVEIDKAILVPPHGAEYTINRMRFPIY